MEIWVDSDFSTIPNICWSYYVADDKIFVLNGAGFCKKYAIVHLTFMQQSSFYVLVGTL